MAWRAPSGSPGISPNSSSYRRYQIVRLHVQCICSVVYYPWRLINLDAQIATLLYMVGHDMDSPLARTALYQLSDKDSKSSSWFVYSYIQLKKYDLDPLNIIQNYISKGDIRRTIRSLILV